MPKPVDSSTSSSERGSTARALVALAVPCVLVLALLATYAWMNRDAILAVGWKGIAIDRTLLPAFERWVEGLAERDDRQRVILYGDSLLRGAQARKAGGPMVRFDLGQRYRRELRKRAVVSASFSLVHAAFRPIHLYYLLDEVVAAEPDLVIIVINLRIFSPAGHYTSGKFLNLSRKLSWAEQFEVWGPLRDEGVGAFDPLVYRLQEQTGTLYMPEGVRSLGQQRLIGYGRRATKALGLRSQWGLPAFTRETALGHYDVDLSADPQAAIARAILERLRASGVSVLFYVSPVNPGPLERVGVLDQLTLSERVDALQRVIGARPDEWLDLHDRLPAGAFRDHQNHLQASGLDFVASELAGATYGTLATRKRAEVIGETP